MWHTNGIPVVADAALVSGALLASVKVASSTAATPAAGQITGSNPVSVTASATGAAVHFLACERLRLRPRALRSVPA
jgi:hypothetical protein